jgi:mannose-6-phosphate isomerase-like protein (cupin superfamily)
MKPGQISRPMRHREVEESWYVLEGEGEVWRCPPGVPPAGVSTVHIGPGDALVIPPGFGFQVRVCVGGPLRMLCSTAPPCPGRGGRPSFTAAWVRPSSIGRLRLVTNCSPTKGKSRPQLTRVCSALANSDASAA